MHLGVPEAEAPLGNQRGIEAYAVQLHDALTAAMLPTNTARFEAVRSCAHELAIEWLRSH
jgi:hypothetical protein